MNEDGTVMVIVSKSAVDLHGHNSSIMSSLFTSIMKRVRGTQSWQRMQIKKNTQANKDNLHDASLQGAHYEKPMTKLNSSRKLKVVNSEPSCESCLACPPRPKCVNFIPLVKEVTFSNLTEEEEQESLNQRSQVLCILGLKPGVPSIDTVESPSPTGTAASGTSTPTLCGRCRIAFIPLQGACNNMEEEEGACGEQGDCEIHFGEHLPPTPHPLTHFEEKISPASMLRWVDDESDEDTPSDGPCGPHTRPLDEPRLGLRSADPEPAHLPHGGLSNEALAVSCRPVAAICVDGEVSGGPNPCSDDSPLPGPPPVHPCSQQASSLAGPGPDCLCAHR